MPPKKLEKAAIYFSRLEHTTKHSTSTKVSTMGVMGRLMDDLLIDNSSESLRYLDWQPIVDDTPPESVKAYNTQLTPLLLNMALTALKVTPSTTRNAEDARNSTTRVLQLDEVSSTDKAKALYRRSLANSRLQEDEAAEKDLVEALTIAPGDEAVRGELDKV